MMQNSNNNSDLIDIENYSFNGSISTNGGLSFQGSILSDSALCFNGKITHDRQRPLEDASFTGYLLIQGDITSSSPISISENSFINPGINLDLYYKKDKNAAEFTKEADIDYSIGISGENISKIRIDGGRIIIEGREIKIRKNEIILNTDSMYCVPIPEHESCYCCHHPCSHRPHR
jgi:hypothetical protein